VRVDPKTPLVAQEVGDFYLIRGDLREAFKQYRTVLESDPAEMMSMLELGWKATDGDSAFLFDNLLPANQEMREQLLYFAIRKDSPDGTRRAWEKLAGLGKPISPKLATIYVGYMIAHKQEEAATSGWAQMVSLDQSLGGYRPSTQNLLVNGGFEEHLLNGGFDWAFGKDPSVKYEMETTDFHSGSRALSVFFDGPTPNGVSVFQFISVKPNTRYHLRFWHKGQELASSAAPKILVADYYARAALAETPEIRGSTAWEEQSAEFTTGPICRMVSLQVVRTSNTPIIRGKLLLDDFVLTAE
jgi:hypothetical protein